MTRIYANGAHNARLSADKARGAGLEPIVQRAWRDGFAAPFPSEADL